MEYIVCILLSRIAYSKEIGIISTPEKVYIDIVYLQFIYSINDTVHIDYYNKANQKS